MREGAVPTRHSTIGHLHPFIHPGACPASPASGMGPARDMRNPAQPVYLSASRTALPQMGTPTSDDTPCSPLQATTARHIQNESGGPQG